MTLSRNHPAPAFLPSCPILILDSFFSVTASNVNTSAYREVKKTEFNEMTTTKVTTKWKEILRIKSGNPLTNKHRFMKFSNCSGWQIHFCTSLSHASSAQSSTIQLTNCNLLFSKENSVYFNFSHFHAQTCSCWLRSFLAVGLLYHRVIHTHKAVH